MPPPLSFRFASLLTENKQSNNVKMPQVNNEQNMFD